MICKQKSRGLWKQFVFIQIFLKPQDRINIAIFWLNILKHQTDHFENDDLLLRQCEFHTRSYNTMTCATTYSFIAGELSHCNQPAVNICSIHIKDQAWGEPIEPFWIMIIKSVLPFQRISFVAALI